jgi:hypothetical protein
MRALTVLLPALLALGTDLLPSPQKPRDVSGLLQRIEKEVREIGGYPGEDFIRGEFFLGPGDDDTCKTHQVGILIKDEAEGPRLTIQVIRLEPAREDPRIKYGRDPRLVVCHFAGGRVELVRSDYSPAELGVLLPEVVRAVADKKALLKK